MLGAPHGKKDHQSTLAGAHHPDQVQQPVDPQRVVVGEIMPCCVARCDLQLVEPGFPVPRMLDSLVPLGGVHPPCGIDKLLAWDDEGRTAVRRYGDQVMTDGARRLKLFREADPRGPAAFGEAAATRRSRRQRLAPQRRKGGQGPVVCGGAVLGDRGGEFCRRAALLRDVVQTEPLRHQPVALQCLFPRPASAQRPEEVAGDRDHGLLRGVRSGAERACEGVAAEQRVGALRIGVRRHMGHEPQGQLDLGHLERFDLCGRREQATPDPCELLGHRTVPGIGVTHLSSCGVPLRGEGRVACGPAPRR